MKVFRLRCDYMENPIGFDFMRPQLGWTVEAEGCNKRQSAYRIQVAATPQFDPLVFDSGKTLSDQSVAVRLETTLAPCTRYYWRVMVWDESDASSDWSNAAFFETARYGAEWKADWIGWNKEFPQLRRDFTIEKPLRAACAYVCGVGLYKFFINGNS